LFFLLLLYIGIFFVQRGLDSKNLVGKREFLFIPKANVMKHFTFGFDNFIADVYWLRCIQYAAERKYTKNGLEWMYRSIDLITELDPRFKTAYLFGGIVLAFDRRFMDESIAVLEKGMKNLPDEWNFPFYIGFNYFFYLREFEKAAEYLMKASRLPGAPKYLPLLATRLLAEARKPETALAFLKSMLDRTKDPTLREKIKNRIKRVIVERDIIYLEQKVIEFEKLYGRKPVSLKDLLDRGIIERLPREPFGGYYYLDRLSGGVKSSKVKERLKLYAR